MKKVETSLGVSSTRKYVFETSDTTWLACSIRYPRPARPVLVLWLFLLKSSSSCRLVVVFIEIVFGPSWWLGLILFGIRPRPVVVDFESMCAVEERSGTNPSGRLIHLHDIRGIT